MKIINIKVKEIKPYEQNPRFNDLKGGVV